MPLSHKEGFAARSSKITPCFGASASIYLSGVVR